MNDHWLDQIARRVAGSRESGASPGEPAITRGAFLGKAAAGAVALAGLGALTPTRSNAARLACPNKNRAACQRDNYQLYRVSLKACERTGDFVSRFRCQLDELYGWQAVDRECRKKCPPPKPPQTKLPIPPGGGKKPPQPPSKPPDPCGSCSYYCSPCAAVSSGFLCCLYPPLPNNPNPCCP